MKPKVFWNIEDIDLDIGRKELIDKYGRKQRIHAKLQGSFKEGIELCLRN